MKKRMFAATAALVVIWVGAGFLSFGSAAATLFTEGFEIGGKTAYAAAHTTLGRVAAHTAVGQGQRAATGGDAAART